MAARVLDGVNEEDEPLMIKANVCDSVLKFMLHLSGMDESGWNLPWMHHILLAAGDIQEDMEESIQQCNMAVDEINAYLDDYIHISQEDGVEKVKFQKTGIPVIASIAYGKGIVQSFATQIMTVGNISYNPEEFIVDINPALLSMFGASLDLDILHSYEKKEGEMIMKEHFGNVFVDQQVLWEKGKLLFYREDIDLGTMGSGYILMQEKRYDEPNRDMDWRSEASGYVRDVVMDIDVAIENVQLQADIDMHQDEGVGDVLFVLSQGSGFVKWSYDATHFSLQSSGPVWRIVMDIDDTSIVAKGLVKYKNDTYSIDVDGTWDAGVAELGINRSPLVSYTWKHGENVYEHQIRYRGKIVAEAVQAFVAQGTAHRYSVFVDEKEYKVVFTYDSRGVVSYAISLPFDEENFVEAIYDGQEAHWDIQYSGFVRNHDAIYKENVLYSGQATHAGDALVVYNGKKTNKEWLLDAVAHVDDEDVAFTYDVRRKKKGEYAFAVSLEGENIGAYSATGDWLWEL